MHNILLHCFVCQQRASRGEWFVRHLRDAVRREKNGVLGISIAFPFLFSPLHDTLIENKIRIQMLINTFGKEVHTNEKFEKRVF